MSIARAQKYVIYPNYCTCIHIISSRKIFIQIFHHFIQILANSFYGTLLFLGKWSKGTGPNDIKGLPGKDSSGFFYFQHVSLFLCGAGLLKMFGGPRTATAF